MPGFRRKIQPGSVPTIWKDIGEEKSISGNPEGNPSEPNRNQVKRIVNNE